MHRLTAAAISVLVGTGIVFMAPCLTLAGIDTNRRKSWLCKVIWTELLENSAISVRSAACATDPS